MQPTGQITGASYPKREGRKETVLDAISMAVIYTFSPAAQGGKIIWHDGIGMSLYAKRLEKGHSDIRARDFRASDRPRHHARPNAERST